MHFYVFASLEIQSPLPNFRSLSQFATETLQVINRQSQRNDTVNQRRAEHP